MAVTAVAANWLVCKGSLDVGMQNHGDEIWILSSQKSYFVAGHPSSTNLQKESTSWVCSVVESGPVEEMICQRCQWFDIAKEPEPYLSKGHLEQNVNPAECLEGSFVDPVDADAWLRRDYLVHSGSYAAACVDPAASLAWWRPVAALALCVMLVCFSCAYAWRRRARLRTEGFGAKACGTSMPEDEQSSTAGAAGAGHCSKSATANLKDPAAAASLCANQQRSTGGRACGMRKEAGAAAAADQGHPAGVLEKRKVDSATQAIQDIHEELLDRMDAPENERKQLMRRYLMRWHPDKNTPEDRVMCTVVLQFLNSKRDWFLRPEIIPETATLLP